jgi:hypothetical protein
MPSTGARFTPLASKIVPRSATKSWKVMEGGDQSDMPLPRAS